jgi:hypothetical protein
MESSRIAYQAQRTGMDARVMNNIRPIHVQKPSMQRMQNQEHKGYSNPYLANPTKATMQELERNEGKNQQMALTCKYNVFPSLREGTYWWDCRSRFSLTNLSSWT